MTAPSVVGVVAAEMEGSPTGVGRVLALLLEGARALPDELEWRLFFHGPAFSHPLFADPRFVPRFACSRGSRVVWEQLRLPVALRRQRLDLLYSPAYSLPRCAAPGVVSLHDLSFELLPGEFAWRERWRRRVLARSAARRAARVLVDCGRVRDEVVGRYRVRPERVGVVPLAVDPRFAPAAAGDRPAELAALASLGVRPPYLLQVGSLLERRRPDLALAAFAAQAAGRPGLELVLAGANRLRDPARLEALVAGCGAGSQVRALGWVDDGLLPALYRHAEASLYLSAYEGFGLPPLESLASGTPAVTAPGLALAELWPGDPWRAERLELGAVVAALERALDRSAAREAALERARAVLARLTPAAAARAFVAELGAAARR